MSYHRKLRLAIRKIILEEITDEYGETYEDTYLDADEPAPPGSLLAEPHHGHEERRISYIKSKEDKKKDMTKSSKEEENENPDSRDEVSAGGVAGAMGPAFGSVDEYDG